MFFPILRCDLFVIAGHIFATAREQGNRIIHLINVMLRDQRDQSIYCPYAAMLRVVRPEISIPTCHAEEAKRPKHPQVDWWILRLEASCGSFALLRMTNHHCHTEEAKRPNHPQVDWWILRLEASCGSFASLRMTNHHCHAEGASAPEASTGRRAASWIRSHFSKRKKAQAQNSPGVTRGQAPWPVPSCVNVQVVWHNGRKYFL